MNPHDEHAIRDNWELLKQELNIEEFVGKLLKAGIWSTSQRDFVLNSAPLDRDSKGQRFLETVVKSGSKCYQTVCNILRESKTNPRYETLIKALSIQHSVSPDSGPNRCLILGIPKAINDSVDTVINKYHKYIKPEHWRMRRESIWRPERTHGFARAPWRADDLFRQDETDEDRPGTPAEAVQAAVQKASAASGNLDMLALEKELVKIAPTIADLFSKIHTQTTTVVATSEEELKKIREDNDRLRKTNRSLVEKLNSFQQKIIQLQLENKKLREFNDNENTKQMQLDEKSSELDKLKEKLVEQKHLLEEKERELDMQLEKLQMVIIDNEEQKLKLASLEQLHEEGLREYEDQQYQIEELQKDKEQQKEQIEVLEEKQKMSEMILQRLEERLIMLEQRSNQKNKNPAEVLWSFKTLDEWKYGEISSRPS